MNNPEEDTFDRFVKQARAAGLPTEREAKGLESRLRFEDVLPRKGRRFFEFDVEGVINVGSFGIVYRVRRDGAPRALKILRPDHLETPLIVMRFWREMDILRKIAHSDDHPRSLARHYSHGEVFRIPYIELELVEGKTLSEELLESPTGTLPLHRVREILLPICDLVSDLHAQGIVHRDIKPSNILLGASDGALRPVLIDFGVATAPDTITSLHSRSHSVVGTIGYLAPEIAQGEACSASADVFSLGAVLCRCVYGHTPYRTGTEGELLDRAKRGEIELPAEDRRDVPRALRLLIERSTRPDPRLRLASAAEFAAALREVRCSSRPPSPDTNGINFARLAFAVLVAVGGIVLSLWLGSPPRHTIHPELDPRTGTPSGRVRDPNWRDGATDSDDANVAQQRDREHDADQPTVEAPSPVERQPTPPRAPIQVPQPPLQGASMSVDVESHEAPRDPGSDETPRFGPDVETQPELDRDLSESQCPPPGCFVRPRSSDVTPSVRR